MGDIAEFLQGLGDDPGSLILSASVFILVFGLVVAVGLYFLRQNRPPDRRTGLQDIRSHSATNRSAPMPASPVSVDPVSIPVQDYQPPTGGLEPRPRRTLRETMGAIHRILSAVIVAVLVALTISAYLASSPHDGSLIVPGVLAMVTLIVALKLHNWRHTFYNPKQDAALRADFHWTVQSDLSRKLTAALSEMPVRWEVGSPEVHRMDQETVDRARAMAADGQSMDDICRSIEPDYEGWSAPHRQAYQAVVRAMIEAGG